MCCIENSEIPPHNSLPVKCTSVKKGKSSEKKENKINFRCCYTSFETRQYKI